MFVNFSFAFFDRGSVAPFVNQSRLARLRPIVLSSVNVSGLDSGLREGDRGGLTRLRRRNILLHEETICGA